MLYLALGLSFVILFILVNHGVIISRDSVDRLDRSYALLSLILLITFTGFQGRIIWGALGAPLPGNLS